MSKNFSDPPLREAKKTRIPPLWGSQNFSDPPSNSLHPPSLVDIFWPLPYLIVKTRENVMCLLAMFTDEHLRIHDAFLPNTVLFDAKAFFTNEHMRTRNVFSSNIRLYHLITLFTNNTHEHIIRSHRTQHCSTRTHYLLANNGKHVLCSHRNIIPFGANTLFISKHFTNM